jgi:drug/metabolite transporter (DMT)-like permease
MEVMESMTNTNQVDPTMTGRPVSEILQGLVAVALFGINAPISKLLLAPSALGQVPPIPMVALLYLGSGVGVLILLALQCSETAAESEARLQRADQPRDIGALAALAFGESIDPHVWGAVGLVTGASTVLSWESGGAFGVSWALATCVLWGIDNNFTRNISAKNPLIIVTVKGFGVGFFSLILALIVGHPLPNMGRPCAIWAPCAPAHSSAARLSSVR